MSAVDFRIPASEVNKLVAYVKSQPGFKDALRDDYMSTKWHEGLTRVVRVYENLMNPEKVFKERLKEIEDSFQKLIAIAAHEGSIYSQENGIGIKLRGQEIFLDFKNGGAAVGPIDGLSTVTSVKKDLIAICDTIHYLVKSTSINNTP